MKFKTKRKTSTPKPAQRCAGCYRWTNQIAMVGYRQVEGCIRVTYIACSKCAARLERNQDDPTINQSIAAYLQDRIPAHLAVGLRKIYDVEVTNPTW